jgi:hypothetical protein
VAAVTAAAAVAVDSTAAVVVVTLVAVTGKFSRSYSKERLRNHPAAVLFSGCPEMR